MGDDPLIRRIGGAGHRVAIECHGPPSAGEGEGEDNMRFSRTTFAAAIVSVLCCTAAASQTPAEGQVIARKLCTNCHAMEGVPVARADVPAFQSIANKPDTTPERLAAAIILPHPEMPGIPLTREEIRALITYIMSLRKP